MIKASMHLLTLADLEARGMTKGELAEGFLPEDLSFDYALPQGWLYELAEGAEIGGYTGNEAYSVLRSTVVWAYPKNNIFGLPCPLCQETKDYLLSKGERIFNDF